MTLLSIAVIIQEEKELAVWGERYFIGRKRNIAIFVMVRYKTYRYSGIGNGHSSNGKLYKKLYLIVLINAIIVHQVNCQKVMGAGLAKQLSEKFPQVKKEYLAKANWNLGDTQFVKIKDDLVVCNLAGQYSFGRKQKVYTNYEALIKGFNSVLKYSVSNGNLNVCIPYGIGCGLAKGNWEKVFSIIVNIFGDKNTDLYCFIFKIKEVKK